MSVLYELDINRVAGSGDFSFGIAGEALGNRKVVYLGVDGRWYLADADLAATMPVIGLTMHAIRNGGKGWFLLKGFIGLNTWAWVVGTEMYASSTPGEMVQVPAGLVQILGVATQTHMIYFHPEGTGAGGVVCALLLTGAARISAFIAVMVFPFLGL